jgi:hypothetical protein
MIERAWMAAARSSVNRDSCVISIEFTYYFVTFEHMKDAVHHTWAIYGHSILHAVCVPTGTCLY